MKENERTLKWVEREVMACRPLALRYFRMPSLRVERKADLSPVTAADRRLEVKLRAAFARAFPGELVVGEEFGGLEKAHGDYWTVDPIDGTRAFSRGLPTWGIMVGRVERGRPTLGVVDFPALDVTLSVARGVKAYERSRGQVRTLPRVRAVRGLEEAVILHGGIRWWPRGKVASRLAKIVRDCYLERAYGDCYGYLWALRGRADAVIDYGVKLWDMVPLAALAHGTGRVLWDFSGRPCWSGPETLFAHPKFARFIVKILAGGRRQIG
jgi:histidinol-phosphatase